MVILEVVVILAKYTSEAIIIEPKVMVPDDMLHYLVAVPQPDGTILLAPTQGKLMAVGGRIFAFIVNRSTWSCMKDPEHDLTSLARINSFWEKGLSLRQLLGSRRSSIVGTYA